MERNKQLLLVTVCPPTLDATQSWIERIRALGDSSIQHLLVVVGQQRCERLAGETTDSTEFLPYDRLWIQQANTRIGQASVPWVALNFQIDLDLIALEQELPKMSAAETDVAIGWPKYGGKNLDLHFWRYQVPQAPSACFLFNRQGVADRGGFQPLYPLVSHWDMMVRLSSVGAHIKILENSFLPEPVSYVPGATEADRLQFLLQGALMLAEHGELELSAPHHLMMQYNLYEQLNRDKTLQWLNNVDVGSRLLQAAQRTLFGIRAWANWFDTNGIKDYPEIQQGHTGRSAASAPFYAEVSPAYPAWLRPFASRAKRYFLQRALKNPNLDQENIPVAQLNGTPVEVSPIYPGWVRVIGRVIKKLYFNPSRYQGTQSPVVPKSKSNEAPGEPMAQTSANEIHASKRSTEIKIS